MRRDLKSIVYPDLEKICFHSFRQGISEFVWFVQVIKPISFSHYVNHIKKESALETIAKTNEGVYGKFGEFMVEWIGKEERICQI